MARKGSLRKGVVSNVVNVVLLNEILSHHPWCVFDHLINPPENHRQWSEQATWAVCQVTDLESAAFHCSRRDLNRFTKEAPRQRVGTKLKN